MKTMVGCALVLVTLVPVVAAASDAVVVRTGNIRLSGAGNALVFPDGTAQTTATLQGPPGIQGIQGAPGPKGDQGIQGPAGNHAGQVLISPAKSLKIGDTLQLVATSLDSGNKELTPHSYTWGSLDLSVASVDGNGLVTAANAGTAIITVLDTTNNISGQVALNVRSLDGGWVSTNTVVPFINCPGLSVCDLEMTESAAGAVSISTNSCKNSCNDSFNIAMTGQRTGSTISLSGTFTVTPFGAGSVFANVAGAYSMQCLDTWDGNNVLNSMCTVPDFGNFTVFNHSYVRK